MPRLSVSLIRALLKAVKRSVSPSRAWSTRSIRPRRLSRAPVLLAGPLLQRPWSKRVKAQSFPLLRRPDRPPSRLRLKRPTALSCARAARPPRRPKSTRVRARSYQLLRRPDRPPFRPRSKKPRAPSYPPEQTDRLLRGLRLMQARAPSCPLQRPKPISARAPSLRSHQLPLRLTITTQLVLHPHQAASLTPPRPLTLVLLPVSQAQTWLLPLPRALPIPPAPPLQLRLLRILRLLVHQAASQPLRSTRPISKL